MHVSLRPTQLALAIGSALAATGAGAAMITVDTLNDPGSAGECSLRAALLSANNQSAYDNCAAGDGDDQIVFAPGLSGTVYLQSGQMEIEGNVTITGPGADQLTLDAAGYSRLFTVDSPEQATISGVTLTGGGSVSYGGAVYVVGGALVLADCVISGNTAQASGGGVDLYGYSTLQIDNCEISGNSSGHQGGGVALLLGNALIRDSLISGNHAEIGGGVAMYLGSADIRDSVISSNQAEIGGGILSLQQMPVGDAAPAGQQALTLTISDTHIVDNQAGGYGGGVMLLGSDAEFSGVTVSGNSLTGFDGPRASRFAGRLTRGAPPLTVGAGIASFMGRLQLSDSTVDDNISPGSAGGIMAFGSELQVTRTTISRNTGGGVASVDSYSSFDHVRLDGNGPSPASGAVDCDGQVAFCDFRYSSISGNHGALVGGIGVGFFNFYGGYDAPRRWSPAQLGGGGPQYGPLYISNSTISDNSGQLAGGVAAPLLDIAHTTIAHNHQSDPPGGPGGIDPGDSLPRGVAGVAGGVLTIQGSIFDHTLIGNNTADSGVPDLLAFSKGQSGNDGQVTMHFSLVSDSDGFDPVGGNNIFDQDPQLAPLDLNGAALTLTHALLPDSPAIDAGDPAIADPPDFDQRGPDFDRIVGNAIDIGAFEFVPPPLEPELALSANLLDFGPVRVGQNATAGVDITSTGTGDVEIGGASLAELLRGAAPFSIDQDTCSGSVLAPGDNCAISIAFNPDDRTAFAGLLQIPSNAPDSPAEVDLQGTGIAPVLAVSPATVDFGAVVVGETSDIATVNLENIGDADLNLAGLTGPDAPFSIAGGDCAAPMTLPAGNGCSLDLALTPEVQGAAAGSVLIQSDSLGGDDSITLAGTGLISALSITPDALNFGEVTVDEGATGTVELLNSGQAPVDILDIGPASAPFGLAAGGSCPAPVFILDPQQACTLVYAFEPATAGTFQETLGIQSTAPDAEFTLQGIGVAGTAPGPEHLPIPVANRFGLSLLGGALLLLGLLSMSARRTRQDRLG